MAPRRTVVAARPLGSRQERRNADIVITILLPPVGVAQKPSLPDDALPATSSSSSSTPESSPSPPATSTSSSLTSALLSSLSLPAGTRSTMMYLVSATPSGDPPPPGQTVANSADQTATGPLRTLAAVFGFIAIVFVLAIGAIVMRARLKNKRRMRRARVRSVFWTRSRSDAMALVLAQPSSYATPGQELWAKQWAELSRAASPRRVPATPAMGTLTSTRTLLAATLLERWSASLRSDVSPGSPPSYRSPSESSARDTGNNRLVQTPATAMIRFGDHNASTARASQGQ